MPEEFEKCTGHKAADFDLPVTVKAYIDQQTGKYEKGMTFPDYWDAKKGIAYIWHDDEKKKRYAVNGYALYILCKRKMFDV